MLYLRMAWTPRNVPTVLMTMGAPGQKAIPMYFRMIDKYMEELERICGLISSSAIYPDKNSDGNMK